MDPLRDPALAPFPSIPIGGDPMATDPMLGPPVAPAVPGSPAPPELAAPNFPVEPPPPLPGMGPRYPAWYTPPPAPDLDDVLAEARQQREDHGERVDQMAEMLEWINGERNGLRERDLQLADAGELAVFTSPEIGDEHYRLCAWVAGMRYSFDCSPREAIDRDEAMAIEDYLMLWWRSWKRDHLAEGNVPLERTLPDQSGKAGMLATFRAVDPSNPLTGIRTRMIDPATCYPVYEGARGLGAVYLIYDDEAGNVVGNFGGNDTTVDKKVREIAHTPDGRLDRRHRDEVIEYWDREWCLVAYGGEEILRLRHRYGTVPFTITPGGFGQDGFVRSPTRRGVERDVILREVGSGGAGGSDRQTDLARLYQPFLWRSVKAHAQKEALGAHLITAAFRAMNPPMVVKKSIMSKRADIQVDVQEGGRTEIDADSAIEPLQNLPAPEAMQPLLALLQQNDLTGKPSGLLLGQSAPQTSGSAVSILTEQGYDIWTPVPMHVEAHLTALANDVLDLLRDFGGMLGPGNNGVLYAPRRAGADNAGLPPKHEVTPELIERASVVVEAKLTKFNPNSLAGLLSAASIGKSLGVLDQQTIIELANLPTDAEVIRERVMEEQMRAIPEVAQAFGMRYLRDQATKAVARGDEKSAFEMLLTADYVAGIATMHAMQRYGLMGMMRDQMAMSQGFAPGTAQTGAAPPPEMGGGVPGVPPPPPEPEGAAPAVAGESLPGYGIATGVEGGRPPGTGGPVG